MKYSSIELLTEIINYSQQLRDVAQKDICNQSALFASMGTWVHEKISSWIEK